ncbi:MBL fold metallo-hydrolase [Miltoncostaea marina]|uniref:MBL fold metallo-hydrolase n=1 Tax=Miltoncostaea marina TaxID=2843215 RepID=UPI001C3D65A9|nr:MBL fold metallo-hydrolase [Miltoncostaea marina]
MRLTLIRHATLRLELGGRTLMVDPMLDPPGARGPVRGTPNERPNPLVPLPLPLEQAVAGVEAVLLTHTHVDHVDAAGVTGVPAGVPWFCQPADVADLGDVGLELRPVPHGASVDWAGLRITAVGGRHGRDEALAQALGPVTGWVVAADGEPTVYVAGDTVWCPEVAGAIARHAPAVVVVNAGGARFVEGRPVTMTGEDVIEVCHAAGDARVVAVHMEAINHCLETRAELSARIDGAGLAEHVVIPADGETVV